MTSYELEKAKEMLFNDIVFLNGKDAKWAAFKAALYSKLLLWIEEQEAAEDVELGEIDNIKDAYNVGFWRGQMSAQYEQRRAVETTQPARTIAEQRSQKLRDILSYNAQKYGVSHNYRERR
jgi:hypothetical protein